MTVFADRVQRVKPSFTLEMTSRAAELRAQGVDVINFSAGQPDFNTPENIRNAAKAAMDKGDTKYTAGSGTIELREAVCTKLKRENHLVVSPDQVLVSNGEKQSLYLACQALFQEGDEVLIFKPYWVSFPEFVTLSDATPVLVNTISKQNFEPDLEDLKSKINDRVKGIILNSPSNPTGSVWSDEAIINILGIAKENGWIVISDECYERLVFEGEFTSFQKLSDDHHIGANIVTCMSLSKTYSMTGWRIGYSFGEKSIIQAMSKIQGQATSCANSIGQAASVEALTGDQSAVAMMLGKFKERRDLMVSLLNDIPGVNCDIPGGAFYAFPDFSNYVSKSFRGKVIKDSFDLCEVILSEAKVVTVPGDGFGAPGHIRFSYPVGEEIIREGISRVQKVLEQLN
ncbi:MAG: pyridoxal phosphate-dependent aminotransferase [Candidatus Marinimicrobia bacterium]|jgi:aspartate aminotransferase|nr:pyridoxal phosphate-dependent aminotransferase [Candidatus Neomarinimicrobiota bacterium]MBT3675516.1 pyridoxal phosphate-dependent aminotransferase [Candidatus Neomarinimicrobiota bacterium]MBT3764145.1 pyridoxal phosphate-dependent aminotransferase [Candidatus Neomarinimicrobiota bacterium]MBT4067727.1 pyridoxal phosphate-dependent aminotransferase [Candidatus Neomarinimicrobiota bacterium]MBT4271613.1 pyridoxal phosphate-dependent aminotransferase [Candidatus Neomarinimicrobiota bacterium